MQSTKVALAPFLGSCSQVSTLGVKATLGEYTSEEMALLRKAERIFFPTARYARIFHALNAPIFPSFSSYQYRRSRILQTQLLKFLGCPHPRTRVYFGNRQKRAIAEDFIFPVTVFGECANPETNYSAVNTRELESLISRFNPVVIRESAEWKERIELICIQFDCVGALRRTKENDSFQEPVNFLSNVFRFIHEKTLLLIHQAGLNEISIEWGLGDDGWKVIGIKRPPIQWTDLKGSIHNRFQHICRLIELEYL
jgi:hypothetical protein